MQRLVNQMIKILEILEDNKSEVNLKNLNSCFEIVEEISENNLYFSWSLDDINKLSRLLNILAIMEGWTMNKLVNLDELNKFRGMLESESRSKLIKYFDNKILEIEKQEVNQLKKVIYRLMKAWKDKDENRSRYYYCIYNNLKNGRIDRKQAIEQMDNYKKK